MAAPGRLTRRQVVAATAGLALAATGDVRRSGAAGATAPARRGARQMATDPLPSWNDGASKQAILDFVQAVTTKGGPQFVAPYDRVATFDNDGTLWTEQPMYAQAFFILDQITRMAADHPEWATEQPYAAVLSGDKAALAALTEADLGKLVAASSSGMTTDAFDAAAREWAATGVSPLTKHLFTESVYQPQLELLAYLRANGFATYIVSGGGIDLMRTFADEVYGIPANQVVGSSGKVAFALKDGVPTLTKLPELDSYDDKDGKPVNIHLHIGQRPILAFGNSDGDQAMLEWTTIGHSPSLGLIVHHDDAVREVAYDRDSKVGRLDTALDAAAANGWVVVSMKADWNRVFPFEA